jgi:tetratricopeptide (TPR) repeat protein
MTLNYKFWILLAAFEIAFGLAIFAGTRQYYMSSSQPLPARPAAVAEALPARSGNITEADLARFNLQVPSQAPVDDPVEISRMANEYFGNGQYDRAAELYEKLLAFGPDNVDTYNNLGLTLHYLGRSAEALQKLNDGIALDSTHQRIWLTLGFVNVQLGNIEEARTALTNAAQVGTDQEIRRSATEMLEKLP